MRELTREEIRALLPEDPGDSPGWVIHYVLERPGDFYRYHVRGENLHAKDPKDRLFSWSVPRLGTGYILPSS